MPANCVLCICTVRRMVSMADTFSPTLTFLWRKRLVFKLVQVPRVGCLNVPCMLTLLVFATSTPQPHESSISLLTWTMSLFVFQFRSAAPHPGARQRTGEPGEDSGRLHPAAAGRGCGVPQVRPGLAWICSGYLGSVGIGCSLTILAVARRAWLATPRRFSSLHRQQLVDFLKRFLVCFDGTGS